jgi:hypothetical protein
LGTSAGSNYAQQLEGVAKDALVSVNRLEFEFVLFNETQVTIRITAACIYKDQFDE